jgi:hypothetical protein
LALVTVIKCEKMRKKHYVLDPGREIFPGRADIGPGWAGPPSPTADHESACRASD